MRHTRLLIFIIVLVIASTVVVIQRPTKRGLDLAGGMRLVLQAETDKLASGEKWEAKHQESIIRIIRSRVDSLGVSEPLIQGKGEDQIVVELPDISKDEKEIAIDMLKSTARMEFRHLYHSHWSKDTGYRPAAGKYTIESVKDEKGNDAIIITDAEGNDVTAQALAESKLILTGEDIKPVSNAVKNPNTMGPAVALEFTREGRKKFGDFTRKNVGEILAVVLDGKILSAPSIRDAILSGEAIIEGSFELDEAQRLAEMINAGALPVPLEIIQIQSVEATLGQDAVNKSIQAGIWGLLAIIVFMVGYYLLPGLLADVSLGIYALLTFAVFKAIPVTLTLPGIAAYILSIGMAVDANILIFERLKEELRTGKTLRAAIDAGFSRAFTSIFDSNMCTLITCAILWYYGMGPIRGFALVLAIGVIISFFTAITVTRTILLMLVNTGVANNPVLFGVGRQWVAGQSGRSINVMRHMSKYFAFSAIMIAVGLYFIFGMGGIKPGIDFTGGSMMQLRFEQPADRAAIVNVLDSEGLTGSMVQRSSDDDRIVFVRTKEVSPEQMDTVLERLETSVGAFEEQSVESIGATISKELTENAIKAVLLSTLAIVLYLTIRFAIGGIAYGFRFGVCAVGALVHDVAIIVGSFALFGYLLNWEIDSLFVTALLTIIGFSVHDTIVIFDRIRENMRHRARGDSFDELVNKSIMQSFARSINTSLTLIFTLVALLLLGSPVIKPFVVALLVGVIAGTYSSIFNAAQLLALWERLTGGKKPALEAVAAGPSNGRDTKPVASAVTRSNGDSGAVESSENAATTARAKAQKKKRRY